jgi:4-amino-4-deoxy-L-arabinose transferase-like glycosyltransferase
MVKTIPPPFKASAGKIFRIHLSTWLAFLLLAIFITFVLMASVQKCETIDEGLFIAGGAAQVHHLNPNIDLTHPPLLRWLSGLSTTLLGSARLPEPIPFISRVHSMELYQSKLADEFMLGIRFFYDVGNDHDRALFWGRFPFVFLGALLGWLVFSQVRRSFGQWPALGALLVFAFTPEVLAHSQWAHADLASSLTLFLVSLAFGKALIQPSWRNDLLLGAAMGLAVVTKLTALVLWPMVLVMLVWFEKGSFLGFLKRMVIVLAIFYLAMVAAYLPDPRLFGPHEFYQSDLARLGLDGVEPLLRIFPLPDTFLKGVIYTLLLGQRGQIAFFHGEVSSAGWWYYFPTAIFLKYPTGLLVVGIAGLAALWKSPLPKTYKAVFTFPPFMILGAAMIQSVNIGVRSVLPIAPYLAFWGGVALWHWRTKLIRAFLILLLATSVVSGMAAYPNFLAYFNPLFGGTANADKWLIDSNLDWGQDLPALSAELRKRGINEVRLAYFGVAHPSYYGIKALDPNVAAPGWYAISRSYLSGWWPPGNRYAWLRQLQPEELVGGSIALFHVDEETLTRSGKHKK